MADWQRLAHPPFGFASEIISRGVLGSVSTKAMVLSVAYLGMILKMEVPVHTCNLDEALVLNFAAESAEGPNVGEGSLNGLAGWSDGSRAASNGASPVLPSLRPGSSVVANPTHVEALERAHVLAQNLPHQRGAHNGARLAESQA